MKRSAPLRRTPLRRASITEPKDGCILRPPAQKISEKVYRLSANSLRTRHGVNDPERDSGSPGQDRDRRGGETPRKRIPIKRNKPRRGRIVDRKYLDWASTQPCCISGELPATSHHVRSMGSPKDDTRIMRLAARYHMAGFGDCTVEHGKAVFEKAYGVVIEDEVKKLRGRYLEAGGR